MPKRLKNAAKISEEDLPDFANGREFDALSDEEKERVFDYYTSHPKLKGTPLSKADRELLSAEQKADRKNAGRPVVREGSRVIAVSLEQSLLRRVDDYAKAHGLKRTQVIARGVQQILDGEVSRPTDKPRRRRSA